MAKSRDDWEAAKDFARLSGKSSRPADLFTVANWSGHGLGVPTTYAARRRMGRVYARKIADNHSRLFRRLVGERRHVGRPTCAASRC